jgi:hypothetical protein
LSHRLHRPLSLGSTHATPAKAIKHGTTKLKNRK